jgi:hypothetical protein
MVLIGRFDALMNSILGGVLAMLSGYTLRPVLKAFTAASGLPSTRKPRSGTQFTYDVDWATKYSPPSCLSFGLSPL